jgi:hypothetical protein
MSKVKYKRFKSYAGPSIVGNVRFTIDKDNSTHLERALYLTSLVESGAKFGTVIAYDGTGMTAGLTQCIAVYPKPLLRQGPPNPIKEQGPLWKMIRNLEKDHAPVEELYNALKVKGWYVSSKSDLRDYNTGLLIPGRQIREEFTPNNGNVSRAGSKWLQAKEWALIFHRLFQDEASFKTQIEFGVNHIRKVASVKPRALTPNTISNLVYEGDVNTPISVNDELDLAMSVFWSNLVNAPAIAFLKLRQAARIPTGNNEVFDLEINNPETRRSFSKRLIRLLGTSTFARWQTRYKRTRKLAIKADIWPDEFFNGNSPIMPSKF